MLQNSRNPIYDPSKLVTEDGEVLTPKYFTGNPLNYRLDMGKAVLNFEGKENITGAGKPFNVLPIAFRALEGELFGNPKNKWCEVYFVNEKCQLGMMMFHGFTVQNLREATRILQYDGGNLTEVVWTVSFSEKKNPDNQKFYIGEFDFQELSDENLTIWREVRENLLKEHFHIYRDATRNCKTLFQEYWSNGIEPNAYELNYEEARQKALIAHFTEKPNAAEATPKIEPKPKPRAKAKA